MRPQPEPRAVRHRGQGLAGATLLSASLAALYLSTAPGCGWITAAGIAAGTSASDDKSSTTTPTPTLLSVAPAIWPEALPVPDEDVTVDPNASGFVEGQVHVRVRIRGVAGSSSRDALSVRIRRQDGREVPSQSFELLHPAGRGLDPDSFSIPAEITDYSVIWNSRPDVPERENVTVVVTLASGARAESPEILVDNLAPVDVELLEVSSEGDALLPQEVSGEIRLSVALRIGGPGPAPRNVTLKLEIRSCDGQLVGEAPIRSSSGESPDGPFELVLPVREDPHVVLWDSEVNFADTDREIFLQLTPRSTKPLPQLRIPESGCYLVLNSRPRIDEIVAVESPPRSEVETEVRIRGRNFSPRLRVTLRGEDGTPFLAGEHILGPPDVLDGSLASVRIRAPRGFSGPTILRFSNPNGRFAEGRTSFALPVLDFDRWTIPVTGELRDISVGDFLPPIGVVDLAIATRDPQRIVVLQGNGAGAFSPAEELCLGRPVAQPIFLGSPPSLPGELVPLFATLDGEFVRFDWSGASHCDGDERAFLRSVVLEDLTPASKWGLEVSRNARGELLIALSTKEENVTNRLVTITPNGDVASRTLPVPLKSPGIPQNPRHAILADLDGRGGTNDLVGALEFAGEIYIVLHDENGRTRTPEAWTIRSPEPEPERLAAGDIDGDGRDEIVLITLTRTVMFDLEIEESGGEPRLGNCVAGSCATRLPGEAIPDDNPSQDPDDVSVGDTDGDGQPDIVIAYTGGSTIGRYRRGDATLLADAEFLRIPGSPKFVEVADFTGDGLADVAAVVEDRNEVLLLRGQPRGGLRPPRSTPLDAPGPAGSDLLVFGQFIQGNDPAGPDAVDVVVLSTERLQMLAGEMDGSWSLRLSGSLHGFLTAGTTLRGAARIPRADRTGDDLALLVGFESGGGSLVSVPVFPNGRLGASVELRSFPPDSIPLDLASGDFSGDGVIDLAVLDETPEGGRWEIFPSNSLPSRVARFPIRPSRCRSTDLNHDGHCDLVVLGSPLEEESGGECLVYFFEGEEAFRREMALEPDLRIPVPGRPDEVGFGDMDADGDVDLYLWIGATEEVHLVENLQGTGFRLLEGTPALESLERPIDRAFFADFDRDDRADLLVSLSGENELRLFSGLPISETQRVPYRLTPIRITTGAAQRVVAVTDFNADGLPDLGVADAVFGFLALRNVSRSLTDEVLDR